MASAHIKERYDNIIKSAGDKRTYRGLVLHNGMKIVLASDPTTDKASAAMDVNIGHMSDPVDLPGLAHFCEHMLFLGTEKYPEENEYSKFLSEHGGSSNAFTSGEHTNYYFDVSPQYFQGALDRFAQFFLAPLFTASATEREINAVNSENDKNLQNDSRRVHRLEKATCNPQHAFSKFGTGNKETLLNIPKSRGQDVRDELLKFHGTFYSSNMMGMCILGQESLDELTEMAVPLFSAVQNKSLVAPEWLEHPCRPEDLGMRFHVVPVKDLRSLLVSWPTPDLQPHYKCNPGHYLGHLIGHEGAGSLLSELKNRGWVNTLVSGQKNGAKGFMFFIVNVDLTEDGIEHVDDIVTLIFQYINLLKREGPQDWVFKECQDLSAMGFRFKDKERPINLTCNTAGLMHDFPLNEVFSGGYLLEKYDQDLINMVLSLLTVEKIRVAVIGKKFSGLTDLKEEWYGTEYSMARIPDAILESWRNAGFHDNLRMPDKNEFIPTQFDLLPRDEEAQALPIIVRDSSATRLWYKQDDKFLLPKGCLSIEFTSPYAYMDPLCTNLTYLYVALLKDALNEYAYAPELAGLNYDLHSTSYGLTMSLQGYNDKQHILLQKILDKMASFKIDPQRFEILKENYERGLKNFKAEQPHQHAMYYTAVVMSEQLWTKDELLDTVDEMTVERLEAFMPQLLSRLHTELLVYGNVTRERACQLADIVEKTLQERSQTKALRPSQQRRFREVQLPDGCCFVYNQTNEVHKGSSLEVYYQCGVQRTRDNMVLELFCQIISEPCFDILRTQEQLGYIVFSGVRRSNGVQGLRVIVQSDRSPAYVEGRIEAFLLKMETHISEMDEASFEKHKGALTTRRLEKPKKLSDQNAKYWSEIISQQYNFDRDDIEIAELKDTKKEDILKFYKDRLHYEAPRRHKLSVHITSTAETNAPEPPPEDSTDGKIVCPPLPEASDISDVTLFKKELGLFPLPKPFITLGRPSSTRAGGSLAKL